MIYDKNQVAYGEQKWIEHRRYEDEPVSTSTMIHLPQAFAIVGKATFPLGWDLDYVHNVERIVENLPPAQQAFSPSGQVTDYGKPYMEEARLLYLESAETALDEFTGLLPDGTDTGISRHHDAIKDGANLDIAAWEIAHQYADKLRYIRREVAPERLFITAKTLCDVAEHGHIEGFSRPVGGGKFEPVPSEIWSVDDVTMRCARAGFNIVSPFDPRAAITHRLFISRSSLMAWATARLEEFAAEDAEDGEDRQAIKDAVVQDVQRKRPGRKQNNHGAPIAAFSLWALSSDVNALQNDKPAALGARLLEEYKRHKSRDVPAPESAEWDAIDAVNVVLVKRGYEPREEPPPEARNNAPRKPRVAPKVKFIAPDNAPAKV